MKITLDSSTFLKNNLTDEEVFYLLSVSRDCNLERAERRLIDKGFIRIDDENKVHITQKGNDALTTVILDSDKGISSPKSLENLVGDLRALFPKGLQQGRYPWRDSPAGITERLRVFEKKFGRYPYEKIVKATENYVKRMTGDPFMKTLKYFIWSEQKGTLESGLANELALLEEGGEDEVVASQDWTNNMI